MVALRKDSCVEEALEVGHLLCGNRSAVAKAGVALIICLILGLPSLGLMFHFWWCRKHGIDPLTAEPRDKYYELRGWDKA